MSAENVWVLGVGTAERLVGAKLIQLAAAGAGDADTTCRCRSATLAVNEVSIRLTIWLPSAVPLFTATPPGVRATMD
jgi:hypothetical protein